jgi:hypothetical protein
VVGEGGSAVSRDVCAMSRKRKYEFIEDFPTVINWSDCVLCQLPGSVADIRCPAKNVRKGKGAGYSGLAKDLVAFFGIGELPKSVKLYEYCSSGSTFLETLLNDNEGCFHKTCRMKYDTCKLERLRKKKVQRRFKMQEDSVDVTQCLRSLGKERRP